MRTALVTGASSGIGAAVARALVARGYRVYGTSRSPASITAPIPGVEYLALDLTDPASIEACAAAAGDVDVLVNNAGESQSGPLEELPIDAVERLFATNVFGAVAVTNAFRPALRRSAHPRIVNSSGGTAALAASAGQAEGIIASARGPSGALGAYRSSKTALNVR